MTLECLYDCLLDIMFLFCRNKLILILFYSIRSNRHQQVPPPTHPPTPPTPPTTICPL